MVGDVERHTVRVRVTDRADALNVHGGAVPAFDTGPGTDGDGEPGRVGPGRLTYVGEPLTGSTHDVTAFRESGLAGVLSGHLTDNLVLGDLGYVGEPVVMPVKKPRNGDLSPAQKQANKHLSGIRAAVERCIAHLKNWKILATGYRRPLRKLSISLLAVTALEFFRLT